MRYSEPDIKYNIGLNNPKVSIFNLKEPLGMVILLVIEDLKTMMYINEPMIILTKGIYDIMIVGIVVVWRIGIDVVLSIRERQMVK